MPPLDPALVARFRRDVDALTTARGPGDGLGVAVSGGPDSLALLLLAAAAFPQQVRAISIDHGLRAEAADECRLVAGVCASLGVPHDSVAVVVEPAGEGLQAAARMARRQAFGDWCRRTRVPWLMTGHQADDQAETVLMRIARGSGVGGLAGIPAITGLPCDHPAQPGDGGRSALLLRPLLRWRRSALADIVERAGLTPVTDPANSDPRFDRARFRQLLATTDLFDPERLAMVAANCRDADGAIGAAMPALVRVALRVADGAATLDVGLLAPGHPEIMHRMVRETMKRLGAYPDGPSVARLIDALDAGRAATLAGIKATPGDAVWRFAPAPPRRTG